MNEITTIEGARQALLLKGGIIGGWVTDIYEKTKPRKISTPEALTAAICAIAGGLCFVGAALLDSMLYSRTQQPPPPPPPQS
jgi:hypothetical protein